MARDRDGRVVFVHGALPGDRVVAEIVEVRKRHARAVVRQVLEPGPGRVAAPCPHLARGCGGCDLQHAELERQRALKLDIVGDAMERIGRFDDVTITAAGGVEGFGYRTTLRCVVVNGRAGFRRARSDETVQTPDCLIAHPHAADILATGAFGSADEVVIRVGARTGERLVVPAPDASGVEVEGVEVVGADEVRAGRPAHVHEEAAGRRWRVSADSFFQSSPDAADLLVATVEAQLGECSRTGVLCDLYSGVGLFAGSLRHDGPIVAVEASASAIADAAVNLVDRDVTLVRSRVERWRAEPADVVVADPSRQGLGRRGVDVVAGTGAPTVILVSCDPAAGARDARLLVDQGFELGAVQMLDLFPQTSHVETVTRFDRYSKRRSQDEFRVGS